jgi:hypothetical protein
MTPDSTGPRNSVSVNSTYRSQADGVFGFHRSDQSVGDAAVVAEARPEGGPEPDREEQDRLESTAIN